MRYGWPIAALLVGSVVLAQAPNGQPPLGQPPVAQPQAQAPANPEVMLDHVLAGWEKSMTQLRSFDADCERITLDRALNSLDTYQGKALFQRGNPGQASRAMLKLDKKGNAQVYEKYLITDAFFYQYSPANKVVYVHDLPKNNQMGEESFLNFLFGMKAADAKKRYQMIWVPDAQHNNKFYHYVKIMPRDAKDQADFSEARLTLWANTMLPRQVWYLQPNKNEITWNFKEVQLNTNIPVASFQPSTPSGWRMDRAPRQQASAVQPKVIRNQNP